MEIGERFVAFSGPHLAILAFTIVGATGLVWYGRARRDTRGPLVVSRILGWTLLAIFVASTLYSWLPPEWDLQQSLPLHLSDILRVVASIALITHRQWAVATTHFLGLTINLQAMLTPDITYGPEPGLQLFWYWSMHVLVMWAPILLTWGFGYRPTWRGYRFTLALAVTWAAITFAVNAAIGTNYGYLNRKPANPSLLDVLGPWPVYVGVELALVLGVWAAIAAIWVGLQRRAEARFASAHPGQDVRHALARLAARGGVPQPDALLDPRIRLIARELPHRP